MEEELTELDKCRLLNGTFLVKVDDEPNKTKSGLIKSSHQKQKTGQIVKMARLNHDGKTIDHYQTNDRVLLNPNTGDMPVIELDGNKYHLGTRDNILVVLERLQEEVL